MKKILKVFACFLIAAALAGVWGCRLESPTGKVALSITDDPVHDPDIDGVWLTIGEVQYNMNGDDSGWRSFEDFQGPQTINLLDYQNGLAFLLGTLELPSGQYEQIRFLLDIPPEGAKAPPTTPGCWVSFTDETTEPLFVPSGLQTGYKAVGTFQVPVNATVGITADFVLHKSLRLTANGRRYLLQPTIRLVVNDQAGAIGGTVINLSAEKVVIFAYEDGTYDAAEAAVSPGGGQFPNSVGEAGVNPETGAYRIAFLAPGLYDLVVTTVNPDTTLSVAGFVTDVTVNSEETTRRDIDMSALAQTY
jgi:hypothetical protein